MTAISYKEVVFTVESGSEASLVAIFNRQTGGLTLYRDGMVAMRDALYDLEHYAATRSYTGAPVEQVAERVGCWGRVTSQRAVNMTSLSHSQYSALMRGEEVIAETVAPLAAAAPTPTVARDETLTWKRGIPASTRGSRVSYYESRTDGQTTYRVGGSAGRWFVVRLTNGSGRADRTPFVGSHERAIALLDRLAA